MVSGCSGKQKEDVVCNVVSEVESSEMDEAEDLEADMTTTEADAEPSTTEAPSESETVTTQPATQPVEQQPTTPEQTPPAHPRKFLQRKLKRHQPQMTEEILLTEVRYLRLPSTYHRQNM